MTQTHNSWATSCVPGTIVSFRFPQGENGQSGKARPCLVIGINTASNDMRLTLAYGTTAETDANRGFDLHLSERAAWRKAGVHRPTRFVLARRLTIAIDDLRFDCGPAGNPIIGRLPSAQLSQLADLLRILGPLLDNDSFDGPSPRQAVDQLGRRTLYLQRYGRRGPIIRTVTIEHRRSRRRSSHRSESAA